MGFSSLPSELKELILSYLHPRDLRSCLAVSREWRNLANSERLWLKSTSSLSIDSTEFLPDEPLEKCVGVCRTGLSWLVYSRLCSRWLRNRSTEVRIPLATSEELNSCRVFVHKHRAALISDKKADIFAFTPEDTHSRQTLHLPFLPQSFTMNHNYIVCTNGNIILVYKKIGSFQKYCAVALFPHSKMVIKTEKIKSFIETNQKFGPYFKTETLVDHHLWVSCLDNEYSNLCVLNLEDLTISDKKVKPRLFIATKSKMFVSVFVPLEGGRINIYSPRGQLDFSCSLGMEFNSLRATEDFIVTFVHYGDRPSIWTCEGRLLWTGECVGLVMLDPVRRLLYTCSLAGKLTAHSLLDGKVVWLSSLPLTHSFQIDDLYLICGKFLIVNVYLDTPSPISHYGLVYDLDEQKFLYEAPLRGYTMHVSDYLWVQKRQNDLIVNVYW